MINAMPEDIVERSEHNYSTDILESKILVVDDAEFSRTIITEVFLEHGFKNVKVAVDGADALRITNEFNPDLVLLDLMMPNIDGFEYCCRIRKNPKLSRIPILVQSATNSPDRIARAFKVGATDFVTKPINANEILARSIVHLENQELMKSLDRYRKRVEKELANAREMQKSIMPSKKQMSELKDRYNVSVDQFFETSSELGGDYWGFDPISNDKFAIYTVDFSGHGVTAALNTFRLHTIMHEGVDLSNSTKDFLFNLNNRLAELLDSGQFATIFYGVIDISNCSIQYAIAGSPSPFIVRDNGDVSMLKGEGVPLGIVKDVEYELYESEFKPDDFIVLYSDALIESENDKGEFISDGKISSTLSDKASSNGKEMLWRIIKMFHSHAGNLPLYDDLTINIYHRL